MPGSLEPPPAPTVARRARCRFTGAFARHYVEMVVVMLVGMAVLAVPARWATDALWSGVDGDATTLMLARMAATMMLPMIAWMRWRRHRWVACLEMAAAMLAPALGAVALLEIGALHAVWALMTIEHAAMFAAMFGVMAARPDEYSHARHRRHDEAGTEDARRRLLRPSSPRL